MSSPRLRPDLVILNANVITLNDHQPAANLVAIEDGRIVWVGPNDDLARLEWRGARVIDCEGQTLVPGFIDAHCHLMAYVSSLLAVDCSPTSVDSIDDIQQALQERADNTRQDQWIRGRGYDEFALAEKRHPSRQDLDVAAPDHPVRLNHRSGHACVLNSVALARVGISSDTPDPVEGVIERDPTTGEPTGLLIEMGDFLDGLIPPLSEQEFQGGVRQASERLLSLGITSLQDATHSNSIARWDTLKGLKRDGSLSPRVTMMAGSYHLDGLLERGLAFGSGDDDINLGAVKIMLTMTTGAMHPPIDELQAIVLRAHDAGFRVAVHAIEAEAVEAAVDALIKAQSQSPHAYRDRIEHCSECSPEGLRKLEGSGILVVTQPGFLYYSGRRYLSEVPKDAQVWLYRLRSLLDAGVNIAASSDAPVIEPNPLIGIYAAVSRRADSGETIGGSEGVSAYEALKMYTLGGAYASFQEADKGSIEVGKLADFTLLDQDPTSVETEQIPRIKVTMTIIGGRVVWQVS